MSPRWIGKSVSRVEDGRLLTGRGTFIDDHPPVANACHAAIVRSPHAHARIRGWDVSAALPMEGVVGVITGADVAKACKPFGVGVATLAVLVKRTVGRAVRHLGDPRRGTADRAMLRGIRQGFFAGARLRITGTTFIDEHPPAPTPIDAHVDRDTGRTR